MTIVVKKVRQPGSLMDDIRRISGVDISSCLQCKKCSNGCPVKSLSGISPSEIIRRLQLGQGDEIISSGLVWTCATCEICFSRCPMKIDMAAVMDALREIGLKKKMSGKKGTVPVFNRAFLNTVRIFGRTYDLGMIASYKLQTSSYMQDTDKLSMMLRKGKISLFPSFGARRKFVKRIFKMIKKREN